jgi:hypothetical protein
VATFAVVELVVLETSVMAAVSASLLTEIATVNFRECETSTHFGA